MLMRFQFLNGAIRIMKDMPSFMREVNFNSLMVRLESLKLLYNVSPILNFNSLMVRLE